MERGGTATRVKCQVKTRVALDLSRLGLDRDET